ncbi:DinB family protein [Chitinophaga lutea]|uniref:DinB family protein n=1 Tax=Chitinophaga lutea TaxID=2488634 RepID=A0A3N4PL43_9BACT|nr:DinB family protein [Chitinophaga lutea]RPE09402.1 DinB family protein [Chitinophaga lutea]
MARPLASEYAEFYHGYVTKVKEDDLLTAFRNQTAVSLQFWRELPENKQNYAYATGKWTLKQMLQHIIDAERIFAYRALRFARKDMTPLASFDENSYADEARVDHRSWADMVEEFQYVRNASEHLFRSFDGEEMERSGVASGRPMSVRALGYVIVGHAIHHQDVAKERYL